MEKRKRRQFTLPPEKAFGNRREGFKKAFSKHDFERREFNRGDPIRVRTGTGQISHCLVDEITERKIIVELNHPLTGKTLEFEGGITEVNCSGKRVIGAEGIPLSKSGGTG